MLQTNQDYRHTTISTVSAPCGAGKSYALCQHIKLNQNDKNHLVVLPSQVLIDQFYTDLKNIDLTMVDKITSVNKPKGQVKSSIVEFFRNCLDTGHVLIITWQAYSDLPYFENKLNWDVYIDELPQIDSFYKVDISKNKQFITDFVELSRSINSDIAEVTIKAGCENKLKQANDSSDSSYKEFKPLYRSLLSANKDVFIDVNDWDTVINKGGREGELNFAAMLNPKQFINATLLAANIEQSLLYIWFSRFHKVTFTPDGDLINKLRYTEHDASTGQRCELYYFFEDRPYSKYRRDTALDDDYMVGPKMDELAVKFFGDAGFLYVTNKDYNSSLLSSHEYAVALPVKPHGLNYYQHQTKIYFNLATNHAPQDMELLNSLGISRNDILVANTFEGIYQCAMRTALRSVDSDDTITIIVPDACSANYVSDLLGGGFVEKLVGFNLPAKLPKYTPSQRNARLRYKASVNVILTPKNDSTITGDNTLGQNKQKKLQRYTYKEESNETCALDDLDASNEMAVTFHKKYNNQLENEFSDYIFETKALANFLKQASNTVIDNKDEAIMINSAIFDGHLDTAGYRRIANFIQSHMMILDFDNGTLTPEQFEAIFWGKANKVQKRSFVICNSYSCSETKPNCFRVFMFYKTPARSIEQHRMVFDSIERVLEQSGYDSKTSGLDKVCRTGIQSFYVPCINRRQQNYAFFRKHGLKRDEVSRYGLDVELMFKTHIPKLVGKSNDVVSTSISTQQQVIKKIVDPIKMMTCNRHKPFFDAAIKLKGLGLSLAEVESVCHDIASNDVKMQKKVPDILASLKKYST